MSFDMQHAAAEVSFLVREYDEAIAFFTQALGYRLVQDTALGESAGHAKRWVVVAPPADGSGANLLLARAATPEQQAMVGRQGAGRVFLFLYTPNFSASYDHMQRQGVRFTEAPRDEPYGRVAVFLDLYGNAWDLIERR
jgi:catechol 2,3-dioxygenase-like lactoylglutathione lyase family enzyme